jgi:MFS family permease
MQTIVSAHTERLRGTMLAFNSSALNLAGVVGPALIGAIVTTSGFHAAYWSAALVAAAAFSLAWVVLPRGEVVEPSEPAQPAVVGE